METGRYIALYIDANNPGGIHAGLDGISSAPLTAPIQVIHKDRFQIRLYWRAVESGLPGTATPVEFPAGTTIVLAAKQQGALSEEATLFMVSAFTLVSPESGEKYYAGTIDLNTVELNATMDALSGDVLDALLDIEVRDAGNTERLSYRIPAQINRQVYDGQGNPTTTAFSGEEDIAEAESQVTVDLSAHALAAAPKAYCCVVKPNGSDPNIFVAGLTISAAQLVAFLSSAPPGPGYRLVWILAK